MKKHRSLRRLVVVVILLVSLALLTWGLWPGFDQIQVLPISPEEMQLPTPAGWLPWFGLTG